MKNLVLTFLAVVSLLLGVSVTSGVQMATAQVETNAASYGADANPTGNSIGGGAGYNNIVDPSTANYTVTTKTQLLNALSKATPGQIIYVDDSAEIDLSGSHDIIVPIGVTLASGRGRDSSLGGLIYTSTMTYHYDQLFRPNDHVTFSGLRLRGPDGSIGSNGADPTITGIWCAQHHGLVVENCEIYQWTFAGISIYTDGLSGLSSSDKGYVHHCYFHHNRRDGYGYGVSVGLASALIEANYFDYGRHFIEGERGTPPTNYEVRYNIFGPNCTHTMVDCHGGNDDPSYGFDDGPDPMVPAGGTLLIHHNTFESGTQASVGIRGVPATICSVYSNWTYWIQKYSMTAFKQRLDNLGLTPYVNMEVYDNWYGTTPPPVTNQPPVLDAIGNKAVVVGDILTFTVSASDPDGDALTYLASNLPQGATFAPATRTFYWTPGDGQNRVYVYVHFQVSDGNLTDSEDITITVTANSTIQADINADGFVNSLDMIRVGQHWGETGSAGWIREDINQDGMVNVLDATLLGQHWTG
jgi:hypothetical protein